MADSDDVGAPSPPPPVNQDNPPINEEGQNIVAARPAHPTCALCKNHGQISSLRRHQRYCPWRRCRCQLCYETNKKRDINAKQVASRRAQAQDEELRRRRMIPPYARDDDDSGLENLLKILLSPAPK